MLSIKRYFINRKEERRGGLFQNLVHNLLGTLDIPAICEAVGMRKWSSLQETLALISCMARYIKQCFSHFFLWGGGYVRVALD